jgi:hypothetical protein
MIVTPGRGLAEIAADRADAIGRLARVTERRCGERCATVRIERVTLTARLDALDMEAAEAKRAEVAQDGAAAARTAAAADPVTGALTTFGLPASHADLVAGLAFAAVLEGVACFAWLLALRPADAPQIAVTPVTQGSHVESVTAVTDASNEVAALESSADEQADDITRVMTAIAAGQLRATVTEIRKFLGCSQTKAADIRKQVAPT